MKSTRDIIRELLNDEVDRQRAEGRRMTDIIEASGMPERSVRRLLRGQHWTTEAADLFAASLGLEFVVDLFPIDRE